MASVAPQSSTYEKIRNKVRRLTGLVSTSQLSNDDLDDAIQTAYVQDMPATIKANLFKEVVEVFTEPNVDRYALSGTLQNNDSVNVFESIRDPIFIEGRRGVLYKSRQQFYAEWPRQHSKNTSLSGGTISQDITAIDISGAPIVEITCASTSGLENGDLVTFANVGGTTELNGNSYTISNLTSTTFEVSQAAPSAFTSGGTWTFAKTRFTLNIGAPILQNEITVGTTVSGSPLQVKDNGFGALVKAGETPDEGEVAGINISGAPTLVVTTKEPHGLSNGTFVTFSNVGGTTELNGNSYAIANITATTFEITQASPTAFTSGGNWQASAQNYGAINYASGVVSFNFPIAPDNAATINMWYYTYSASRPLSVMWWKNELFVRPVPDGVYKIELEAFRYPSQFSDTAETPIIKQWWQYLAYLGAKKVMEEYEDMEGLNIVTTLISEQEDLIRNRMACEEIGQRNPTIYSDSNVGFYPSLEFYQ